MKASDFASSSAVAACAIACLAPMTARGAGPSVLEVKREQQQGTNLCWAAVSTMAVRAFQTERPDPDITQQLTVVYGLSQVHNRVQKWVTRRINFNNFERRCSDLAQCDRAFEPWLYRIDSDQVGDGLVLPEAAIAHEIGQGKRPVIIRWNYSGITPPRDDLPKTEHALIITGYDPDNHLVRIFDPWPPLNPARPASPPNEKWHPYAVYVDPRVGLGMPITAIHKHDIYKMRRINKPAPEGVPAPVPLAAARPVTLTPVTFVAALDGAKPVIEEAMRRHVVRGSDGRPLAGEFIAGAPIPIVAISQAALVDAREQPERLLAQRTSSLVVPITRQGGQDVVDSILVYHDAGAWTAGGYSNTAIVRLAAEARRELALQGKTESGFYLVSLPERPAYFAGHGEGADAMMASLDRNPEQGLVRGNYALNGVLDSLGREGVQPTTLRAAR
jgi:hypothetical protein